MQPDQSRPSPPATLKSRIYGLAILVALLWGIELVNLAMNHGLNEWGIRPREARGLPGILFAPFLHNGINHLVLNTVPLLGNDDHVGPYLAGDLSDELPDAVSRCLIGAGGLQFN